MNGLSLLAKICLKWKVRLFSIWLDRQLGCTTPSTPPGGKVGENANFVSFDTMDFKIQALLNCNLVIKKLANKSHIMNFHPLYHTKFFKESNLNIGKWPLFRIVNVISDIIGDVIFKNSLIYTIYGILNGNWLEITYICIQLFSIG